MIIHTKGYCKCVIGSHLYYFTKYGVERAFDFPGFIKCANRLFAVEDREMNFRFEEDKENGYKYKKRVKPDGCKSVRCYFNADHDHLHEDVYYASDIVKISQKYNLSPNIIQNAILNKKVKIHDKLYNNVNIFTIDPFIACFISASNEEYEKHIFEKILIPKFKWYFHLGLQVFPLSYNLTSFKFINKTLRNKKITQKFFMIVLGALLNSFGINISIDIHFLISYIIDFLKSKQLQELNREVITEKHLLSFHKKSASQIADEKIVRFLGIIQWETVNLIFEFIFFTFRIIDFSVKVQGVYYNIFYDFSMGMLGLSFNCPFAHQSLQL